MLEHITVIMRATVQSCQNRDMTFAEAKRLFAKEWLDATLKATGNNQCAAADRLGVHRNTMHRYMRDLDIQPARKWKAREN